MSAAKQTSTNALGDWDGDGQQGSDALLWQASEFDAFGNPSSAPLSPPTGSGDGGDGRDASFSAHDHTFFNAPPIKTVTPAPSPVSAKTVVASSDAKTFTPATPAASSSPTPAAEPALFAAASPATSPSGNSTPLSMQTVTNVFNFTASGQQDVPGTPSFNFNLPASLYGSYNSSTKIDLGFASLTLAASIQGGLKGGLDISAGTYSYDYPVTIGVTMARQVTNGEVFTVDPQLIGVDDATFSMVGASATASLSVGFKTSISAAVDGDSFGSLSIGKTFSFPTSYSHSIPGIPGSKITISEPAAFNAQMPSSVSSLGLPTLTASGFGNNVVTASLDLVEFAAKELDDVFPGIGEIDGDYNFEPLGSLNYSLFSAPLSLGLGIAQTVTLNPVGINETLKEMINGSQVGATVTGPLGSTSMSVTAPSTGQGEIDIDASYALSYQVVTNYGLEGTIGFAIGGPKVSGNIFGADFDEQLGLVQFGASTDLGTLFTETANVTSGAQSTVYKVFYGYPLTAESGQTLTITPTTVLPSGAITLNNNSQLFFTNAQGNPYRIPNDIVINGTGTFNIGDNSAAVVLDDEISGGGSSDQLKLEGGIYDIDFGITVASTTLVNGQLHFDYPLELNPGDFTIDSGATMELFANTSLGSLAGLGTVETFGASHPNTVTLTVGGDNKSTEFDGAFTELSSATLNFVKTGMGTMRISAVPLWNGSTTINQGTLYFTLSAATLGSVNILSAGEFELTGNATLGSLTGFGKVVLNNGNTATFSIGASNLSSTYQGQISSPNESITTLNKVGTGTLALQAVNPYTGATTVTAGTLEIDSLGTSSVTGSVGSSSIVVSSGATMKYVVNDTVDNNYVVTALISGAGKVALAGADGAITVLNNANTFQGGAVISSGIVEIENSAALGTGTVTMTGGALRADLSPKTLANAFTLSGTIGLGASTNISGAVTLAGDTAVSPSINGGSSNWSGPVNLGAFTLGTTDVGPDTRGATWHNLNLTISGAISGSGGVTQNSSGQLILDGANTYTGKTIVDQGNLQVVNFSTNSAVGVLGTGDVTVDDNAVLQFFNVDTVDNGYVINNNITGFGSVFYIGPDDSVTTVEGDNTYGGGTYIQTGIVDFYTANPFGAGVVNMYGGALRATGIAETVTNNFSMKGVIGFGAGTSISGDINIYGDTTVTPSENAGDDTWSGSVILNSFTLSTSDTGPNIDGATWAGEALTISGAISGTGGITQGSSGTLVLSGTNTYSGGTTVAEGTLSISSPANLGTGPLTLDGGATLDETAAFALANAVTLSGGVATIVNGPVSFDVSAFNGVISGSGAISFVGGDIAALNAANSFSGGVTATGNAWVELLGSASGLGSGDLTMLAGTHLEVGANNTIVNNIHIDSQSVIDALSGDDATLSGIISDATGLTGSLLVDSGGVLTLSGANTYSGGTTIDSGTTLAISGAGTLGAGGVTLQSGATLSIGAGSAPKITGTSSFAGTVSGAGTWSLGAGTATVANTATLSVANWSLAGANVTLNKALNYSGVFSLGVGSLLTFSTGVLALKGAATTLSGGAFAGTQRLQLQGATTVSGAVTFGGSSGATIFSTLTESGAGAITLGDSSGSAVSLTNLAAGVINITNNNGVSLGNSAASTIANSGTIEKTAGGGLSVIGASVAGAGAIKSQVGAIEFTGASNSLSGALSGTGKIYFAGGGSTTLTSAATLSAAGVLLTGTGTTLRLQGSLSYSGSFSQVGGTSLLLTSGITFTLTGTSSFGGSMFGTANLVMTGGSATILPTASIATTSWKSTGTALTIGGGQTYAGVLTAASETITLNGVWSLAGQATLTGDKLAGTKQVKLGKASTISGGLTLGGTTSIANFLSVTQSGGDVVMGDSSNGVTKIINTGASTIWKITDDSSIKLGNAAAASINNTGIIEKTGGQGGSSVIAAAIINGGNGKIEALAGTLDLKGAISAQGYDVVSGAATLEFDGGVASTQTVQFQGANSVLDLTNWGAFSGSLSGFDLNGATNDTIDVSGPWAWAGFNQSTDMMSFSENGTQHSVKLAGSYIAADFHHSVVNGVTQVTYG